MNNLMNNLATPPRLLLRGAEALCWAGLVATLAAAALNAVAAEPVVLAEAAATIVHVKEGFVYEASAVTGSAVWTAELLTPDSLAGDEARAGAWYPDRDLPVEIRATDGAYDGSGYHRGHQAASANHRTSAEAQASTFCLSNAAPQAPALNQGPWSGLEQRLRSIVRAGASRRTHVLVVTAPLYLDRHRKPKALEGVLVPTHWSKTCVVFENDVAVAAAAWLAPNTADGQLENVAIDRIEGLLQRDLFPFLTAADEKRLEREPHELRSRAEDKQTQRRRGAGGFKQGGTSCTWCCLCCCC